jgi:hypothetical protein
MGIMSIPSGLCATCLHMRIIRSDRGSVFYQCPLSFADPRFPKYPHLPVLKCSGWHCGDELDQSNASYLRQNSPAETKCE